MAKVIQVEAIGKGDNFIALYDDGTVIEWCYDGSVNHWFENAKIIEPEIYD